MATNDVLSAIFRELIADDGESQLAAIRLMQLNRRFLEAASRIRTTGRDEFNNACKLGQLLLVHNFLFVNREEHGFSSDAVRLTCLGGHTSIVKLFYDKFRHPNISSDIIRAAFMNKNDKLINIAMQWSFTQMGVQKPKDAAIGACESGDIGFAKTVIERFDITIDNDIVSAVFRSGNMEMIEEYSILAHRNRSISTPAHWNRFIYDACKSGNMEAVTYLINRGVTNFLPGFNGACDGNHTKIIEMMINLIPQDKGSIDMLDRVCQFDNVSMISKIVGKFGFSTAVLITKLCKFGRYDLLKTMTHCLSQIENVDLTIGLASKYPNIVQLLLPLLSSRVTWTNLFALSHNCSPESARLFIKWEAKEYIRNPLICTNWYELLERACADGERLTVELILDFYSPLDWESLIQNAIYSDNIHLIKLLVAKSTHQTINWDEMSIRHARMDVIEYVVSRLTNLDRALADAFENDAELDVLQYLLKRGANFHW